MTQAPPPSSSAQNSPGGASPRRRQRTWIRDTVEILVIALILYAIIWSALQTVRVDGHSMDNSLHDTDLLLASKISFALGDPQRGDIVVLIPPVDPSKDFIKRIVGLPGDIIEIDGGDGTKPAHILIKPGGEGDFQVLNEPYVTNEVWTQNPSCCDSSGKATTATMTPVTIPKGDYFVMGDNRNHSEDSRYFGFVARDKIVAKAFLRIWPFFHFGLGPGGTLLPSAGAAAPIWWFGPRRRRKRRRRREHDQVSLRATPR